MSAMIRSEPAGHTTIQFLPAPSETICIPMAIFLWKEQRIPALLGLFAGGSIVYASTSSGPLLMTLFMLAALIAWKLHNQLRLMLWGILLGIIALDIVTSDPFYFILARIDLAGGSTDGIGRHLFSPPILHLNEWWAVGTDYTRHWMPTGIPASDTHTTLPINTS